VLCDLKKPITVESRQAKAAKEDNASDLSDDGDDDCDCDKSFSSDELSEADLKLVQGDILSAITKFD